MAIVLVLALTFGILWWPSVRLSVLILAVITLAVVSFIDDVRGLKPSIRFIVQATVAAVAVAVAAQDYSESLGTLVVAGAIAWLWIAGYTNAFNFMDGINGIAGIQGAVTALGTVAVATQLGVDKSSPMVLAGCAVAGAAFGFLPHNFPKARVFMGDVGSAPLGFMLATLAFWLAEMTSWWVMFWVALLHANFVLDTAITLVRRALRHERLHESHREHFYQRLVRAGYSHTQVTLTEAGLQVLVAVALWWATPAGWGVKAIVAVAIIALWLGFFAFAEREFRRAIRQNSEMPKS